MKKIFLILAMAVLSLPAVAFGATKNATGDKASPAVVSTEQMNITGTVETFREAGMWFARLHTGQGKPLMLGAMGNIPDDTWDCLEKAAETDQSVTLQGLLETFGDGSSGMNEKTVQCASNKNYLEQIEYVGIIPPPLDAKVYTKDEFFRKLFYNKQCGGGRSRYESKYISDNDDPKECYNRGVAILKNDGNSLSPDKKLNYAFGHFKFAAEKDFVPAQYAVGVILASGYEGEYKADGDSAVEWLQRAADQGYAQAAAVLPPLKKEAEKVAKEKAERQRRLEDAKRLRAEREQQAQGATGTEARLSQNERPNKRSERKSVSEADVKNMRERLDEIEYDFISGNIAPEEARIELEALYKFAASHGYIDGMHKNMDKISELRSIVNIAIHKIILRDVQKKYESIRTKHEPSDINLYNDFLSEISSLRSSSKINCNGGGGRECSQSQQTAQDTLEKMYKNTRETIDSICADATQKICDSHLKGFPEEFKLDVVALNPGNSLTLANFVCAAINSDLYKKFTPNGLFSKDIKLELHSGTIYFTRSRFDTKTWQEVGPSFNGPDVINLLLADVFESVDGQKIKITQSGKEMEMLYMRMGGLPKAPECPR